jgi:hypothetical protein
MGQRKPDTYTRAHRSMMGYILSFCLSRIYGDEVEAEYPRTWGGLTGFVSTGYGDGRSPEVGDLILLSSCAPNKWQLGWLRATRELQPGWPEYLIASAEDGELCWWGNVGISYFQRRAISPSWRWTDRQFEVWDRWNRAYKRRGGYIVKVCPPDFGEDGSVTLSTRITHGLSDDRTSETFPDWRKVTLAQMLALYDRAETEHEAASERRRAEREAVE